MEKTGLLTLLHCLSLFNLLCWSMNRSTKEKRFSNSCMTEGYDNDIPLNKLSEFTKYAKSLPAEAKEVFSNFKIIF